MARRRTCGEELVEQTTSACGRECSKSCSKGCIVSFVPILLSNLRLFLYSIVNFSSLKSVLIEMIHHYQTDVSPYLNTCCLFEPSCSNYAIQTFRNHGLLMALLKVSFRIVRCNAMVAHFFQLTIYS
ncbi:membrane protein insertion efficiency factor YidD [candidate division KSB1 bacterium]|nr:membrane protein insertion efficiency factor YidD [candidate division KSB1 bacterium]